ncbi:methyltransferase type 12 [Mycobacterium sp. GA-1841]|uniref:class I SAM-dependent methyltransferase n=1 Tax=Mycobacterium sp. GA-1841 TaxID=1834154 RepID=UPI00096D2FF4|nr:class I SAM-dependent methyltransferase [Mycobacterium sp. GA-1841]OMC37641.1 methyltransferase type 12 [Mycobacterium sp. GA-1841]
MWGQLYERALGGERCWIRHDNGNIRALPIAGWLGGRHADRVFDHAVLSLCSGPTIDLGCGPGRLVTDLLRRGVPALGVDQSAAAVELARRGGAPVLRQDLFGPLPGAGWWQTVLLADGNIGLGGDPWRVLRRAGELLSSTGSCIVEFDSAVRGVCAGWVRLETVQMVGPWFRWASVGVDCAAKLAEDVGLTLTAIQPVGSRVIATLAGR